MALDSHLDVTVTDTAVEFTFTVTNADTEPVDLEFRSGKAADIAVSEDDRERWRWSEGKLFTQALQTETLAPGESFLQEGVWQDPPPGEYTAEAWMETRTLQLAERTAFVVES